MKHKNHKSGKTKTKSKPQKVSSSGTGTKPTTKKRSKRG